MKMNKISQLTDNFKSWRQKNLVSNEYLINNEYVSEDGVK